MKRLLQLSIGLPILPALLAAALHGTAALAEGAATSNSPGHTRSELGVAHRHPHRHHAPPLVAAPATPQAHHVARPPAHPGANASSKVPTAKTPPSAAIPGPLPAGTAKTEPKAAPAKGSVTGLPLPRWAALRTDDVNMRSGPGTRYPIQWVYKRRDLPVMIDREFEVWRLIQDDDGVKGWVHQATLVGHRSFVVTGAEATLRRRPDEAAEPVARLKPGVIGRLRTCEAASPWCEVQVGDYRGYLKRDAFWGTSPNEAVGG